MLNNVTIQGRLARDPELRTTQSGTVCANFTLATDRGSKDQKVTSWIDCVAWRHTASFLGQYFKKGDSLIIEGNLQTRTYKNNEDKTVKVTEVLVNSIHFAGGGKREESQETPVDAFTEQSADNVELPFDF